MDGSPLTAEQNEAARLGAGLLFDERSWAHFSFPIFLLSGHHDLCTVPLKTGRREGRWIQYKSLFSLDHWGREECRKGKGVMNTVLMNTGLCALSTSSDL